MRILGVDPGTWVAGYGIIDASGDKTSLVACGALVAPANTGIPERLSYLYKQLCDIISRYQPEAVAVETPFVSENARTALAIGKAQAVALLAAANLGLPVYEYPPAQVKLAVASNGNASKEQVQEMVRLHLNLSEAPEPADAADALAVAICHHCQIGLAELVQRGQA